MSTLRNICFLATAMLASSSCTVLNNMYVSDPEPAGQGKAELYLGGGTGLRPKTEKINNDGDISFSGNFSTAPNFVFGGRYGLGEKTDLRFSLHLPYFLAGVGMRGGVQYSFFENNTRLNAAFGGDLGFVYAKDSITILHSTSALNIESNGAVYGDVCLPVSFRIGDKSRIILTPRYSLNMISVRYNENYRGAHRYFPKNLSFSLGARFDRLYLEATLVQIYGEIHPNFGIVYFPEIGRD